MVNSGEDVDGLRGRVKSNYMAAPSSYSVRYDPLESGLPSDYSYLYGEVGACCLLLGGVQ